MTRSGTLAGLAVLLVTATLCFSQNREAGNVAPPGKVFVDGKQIPVARILVKDGANYVEAMTLVAAMGGTALPAAGGLMVSTPPKLECEKDKDTLQGQRFSEPFRADVAGVADEIESLRAVVMNSKESERVSLAPRFDAIDRKLSLSTTHVQTDADMAVYYALSYANNSLAISYYKQARGVIGEEPQKEQLDSMMCAMESKFALMKGVLPPGGSCSVFKRMEAQAKKESPTTP